MEEYMEYQIVAVKVGNREGVAQDMQRILTEHGCFIKVRLGLHDTPTDSCSPAGLVIMEVVGEEPEIRQMVKKLDALPETSAKYIVV
jgi:hypothetical protein